MRFTRGSPLVASLFVLALVALSPAPAEADSAPAVTEPAALVDVPVLLPVTDSAFAAELELSVGAVAEVAEVSIVSVDVGHGVARHERPSRQRGTVALNVDAGQRALTFLSRRC